MKVIKPEFVHSDSRRILKQLFTADIKQVNYYEAKSGSVLGDHYHKKTTEYFLITSGILLYNNNRALKEGDCFVVSPGEIHSLECVTDIKLVSFLTKPCTKEDTDIWKKEN